MSLLDRFLTSFRSEDRGAADRPGLVQNEDGTVDLIAPDGTRTPLGNGGSSPFATEILVVEGSKTLTDCSKLSDGIYWKPEDVSIIFQKGSDLSIGPNVDHFPADSLAVFSVAGGSFQVQSYFNARLTADAGSDVQRFINYYTASTFGANPPNLGSDHLVALIDALPIDDSTFSAPYFDIAAGEVVIASPSFSGAQGVSADTVLIDLILTVWSV